MAKGSRGGKRASGGGNSLNAQQKATFNEYVKKINNDGDIHGVGDNFENAKLVSMAYDDAIKNVSKNMVYGDYYSTGRFLPYKIKTRESHNSNDHYLINNGYTGSYKKTAETKTTVTYTSSKNSVLKIDKSDFIEEKKNSLEKRKRDALESVQENALYRIAKKNKVKVNQKMSTSGLKSAISNAKTQDALNEAKSTGIWDMKIF